MLSPTLTRRALIAGAGATLSAAALGAAIVPTVAAGDVCAIETTPQSRYDRAVAELKAAALALRPDLDQWKITQTDVGVLVWGYSSVEAAKPLTVRWDGDGVYETIDDKGRRHERNVWHITRAPSYDVGEERWFSLSSGFSGPLEPADWYCPERNLPTLARKIRSLA